MSSVEQLDAALAAIGVEVAATGPTTRVVRLPCRARGSLAVTIDCGERRLTLAGFLLRAPDRDRDAVYARLLRKHWTSGPWRFALDDLDDVHVLTRLDAARLDADELDEALGALSVLVDEVYEGLVRTGFDLT